MKNVITVLSNTRLSIWATFLVNVLIAVAGLAIIFYLKNPLGLMVFYLLQPVFVADPGPVIEDVDLYGDPAAGFTSTLQ